MKDENQGKTLARVGGECLPDQPRTASVNEAVPATVTPDHARHETTFSLSPAALMLLVESVWAVSARRAFNDGHRIGVSYGRESKPSPYVDVLARAENVHNAAMVLVKDEVARRVGVLRERLQSLHDRASPDTSYGKSQRAVLRMALEELQTADNLGPPQEDR